MNRLLVNTPTIVVFVLVAGMLGVSAEKKDYPITPVPFTAVKVADGFSRSTRLTHAGDGTGRTPIRPRRRCERRAAGWYTGGREGKGLVEVRV